MLSLSLFSVNRGTVVSQKNTISARFNNKSTFHVGPYEYMYRAYSIHIHMREREREEEREKEKDLQRERDADVQHVNVVYCQYEEISSRSTVGFNMFSGTELLYGSEADHSISFVRENLLSPPLQRRQQLLSTPHNHIYILAIYIYIYM